MLFFAEKECEESDYKLWSPTGSISGRSCLLGRQVTYQRRLAHANCYNGLDYVRSTTVDNCQCHQEDFECDFGFLKETLTNQCVRDPDSTLDPFAIPASCTPGAFYNRTR